MEEFLSYTFYGNTIGKWATAMGLVILSVLLGKALYWALANIGRRVTARTATRLDDIVLDMVEEPLVLAVVLFGTWFSLNTLTLPEFFAAWTSKVIYIVAVLAFAWMLSRLFEAIVKEYVVPIVEASESDFDDQLLPIVRRACGCRSGHSPSSSAQTTLATTSAP